MIILVIVMIILIVMVIIKQNNNSFNDNNNNNNNNNNNSNNNNNDNNNKVFSLKVKILFLRATSANSISVELITSFSCFKTSPLRSRLEVYVKQPKYLWKK